MKKLFLALFAILPILAGCNDLDIKQENILGKWEESYPDYPNTVSHGVSIWTFDENGIATMLVGHVQYGDAEYKYDYSLGVGDDIITVSTNIPANPYSNYKIIKLTKSEMEWQKVGTTYSRGVEGSDYRHFKRIAK